MASTRTPSSSILRIEMIAKIFGKNASSIIRFLDVLAHSVCRDKKANCLLEARHTGKVHTKIIVKIFFN
jgi:hypothetical protein